MLKQSTPDMVEVHEYRVIDRMIWKDTIGIEHKFVLVQVIDYVDDELNWSYCYVADEGNLRDLSDHVFEQWYCTDDAIKVWRDAVKRVMTPA